MGGDFGSSFFLMNPIEDDVSGRMNFILSKWSLFYKNRANFEFESVGTGRVRGTFVSLLNIYELICGRVGLGLGSYSLLAKFLV